MSRREAGERDFFGIASGWHSVFTKESLAKPPGCFEDSHGISPDDSFCGRSITGVQPGDTRDGLGGPTVKAFGGGPPKRDQRGVGKARVGEGLMAVGRRGAAGGFDLEGLAGR